MAGIAQIGNLEYNGFVFPPAYHTTLSITPIADSANRVEKYLRHTLTVTFYVHPGVNAVFSGDDLNTGMQTMIRLLSEYGRTLKFTDAGLGSDWHFNNIKRDVNYGPKPQVTDIEMVGAMAARVTWTVVVDTVYCSGGLFTELTYNISWNITEDGLTQRTINGHMEIPARLLGGALLSDHVDRYRERFQAPKPPAFTRTSSWNADDAKRILRFSITDTEIPSDNPYSPGIVRPNVSYSLHNTDISLSQWHCELRGTLSVAQGIPRAFCWNAFTTILNNYRNASLRAIVPDRQNSNIRGGIVYTDRVSLQEDPFSRSMSFSVSWLLACDIPTLLQASGLWTRVTDNTWQQWSQSLALPQGPRGYARMGGLYSDDRAVNLCRPNSYIVNNNTAIPVSQNIALFRNEPCPDPQNSWIHLSNEFQNVQDDNSLLHRRSARPETQAQEPPTTPLTQEARYPSSQIPLTHYAFTQRRGPSTYLVRMRGSAVRAGYPVPLFTLTRYGNQPVTRVGPRTYNSKVKSLRGCKIYAASWNDLYLIHGTPTGTISTVTELDPSAFL